jgi:hypothetical protein
LVLLPSSDERRTKSLFFVLTATIVRAMMDPVNTSETSVSFYQTARCNISEDIFRAYIVFLLACVKHVEKY